MIMINLAFQNESAERPHNIMPKLLSEITRLIETHITDTVTLRLLSEKLFLNGTYISRKFKDYTGLTLQQYLVDKRIALAKQYLTEGKSVTDTCYLSGFKNYSNFIRSFTKQTGISPGKFKHSLLSNKWPPLDSPAQSQHEVVWQTGKNSERIEQELSLSAIDNPRSESAGEGPRDRSLGRHHQSS
ncbi:Bifunctional transcriptional activator/DNA repair enzyme AdaA [compost metagenome]